MLLWSVVGYTVFTALTALSWDIWSFAFFQFGSRIFLGAEYAVGITMIVEEYPATGRALSCSNFAATHWLVVSGG